MFGAVAGLALWNKYLVALLPISLLVGLAVERRSDLLLSRWLLVGGLVALALALPTLIWQVVNGFPQLEMTRALSDRLGAENRVTLVPLQLVMLGPLLLPLLWAGVRWLISVEAGRRFRPLVWTYLAALLLTFLTGGRPYYPLPLVAVVAVAGSVAVEHRWRRLAPWLVAANAVLAVPLTLPVLPVSALSHPAITTVNDTPAEQVGWQSLATTVADIVDQLPADQDVILLTGAYGEAAALDRYGPELGLPTVYSGHNSYWHWRLPENDGATVVAIRMSRSLLEDHFGTCELVALIDNQHGINNEAQGAPIWVCRDLIGTWQQRWPAFRHYN